MPTETRKTAKGVSLNQFINVAVAEKLAHLQHQEWAANRKRPSAQLAARAFSLLEKTANNPLNRATPSHNPNDSAFRELLTNSWKR